jgi:FKBP-type peptidyl-prolyl cis-trans isomerase
LHPPDIIDQAIIATMATQLDKKLLSAGNNKDYPKAGDEVAIEYTGWLYDSSKADQNYKGNQYVISLQETDAASMGRSDL